MQREPITHNIPSLYYVSSLLGKGLTELKPRRTYFAEKREHMWMPLGRRDPCSHGRLHSCKTLSRSSKQYVQSHIPARLQHIQIYNTNMPAEHKRCTLTHPCRMSRRFGRWNWKRKSVHCSIPSRSHSVTPRLLFDCVLFNGLWLQRNTLLSSQANNEIGYTTLEL